MNVGQKRGCFLYYSPMCGVKRVVATGSVVCKFVLSLFALAGVSMSMRHTSLFISLVVSLSVVACSKGGETPAPAATGTGAATAEASAPAAPPAEASAPAAAAAEASAPAVPVPPPAPTGETCADAIPLQLAANAGVRVFGSLNGHTNDFEAEVPVTGYSWNGADLFYKVELNANDVVRIALHDGGTFDGGSWIFSDCANPAASAIGGADTNSGATFYEAQAPTAGAYYIAVDAFASGMTGQYALIAHRTPENPGPVPTPGETCANATVLTLPVNFFAMLDGGANDFGGDVPVTNFSWTGVDHFYAFDLAAGESLHVNLDDNGSFDGGFYAFTDCNNIGAAFAGLDSGSDDSVTVITPPAPGRVYLAVDSFAGATTGNYTLSVY